MLSGKFDRRRVRRSNRGNVDTKPRGLWYSCGGAWRRWMAAEEPAWLGQYSVLYRLDLDMSQILQVTTLREFDAFEAEYGDDGTSGWAIDWEEVAESFMGIEICPYRRERRATHWYNGWDIASGCIWDPRAILGWTATPL